MPDTVALPPAFENVIEAWKEALAQEFDPEGAIAEFEVYFAALGETWRQMGEVTKARADSLADETPLAGPLLEHMDEAGDGMVNMGDTGDEVHATWRTDFAYDIGRQEEPRTGETMLNVNVNA